MKLTHKKVLVTGADGFIGSHLTEALLEAGCFVRALSLYNSFNNWGWLESVEKSDTLEVVCGDVRDPHFCKEITKDIGVIFNLAALIGIPYSYISPDSYVDTNVKGTLNICQAARENGCERLVHTSTSEVYGTAQYVPIDEKHPLQPQSPYSASKVGADSIALSFYNSFELPVTIARPFNTYGPRQSARAIIPTIITQIINGKQRLKLGDLSPTRDLNYVEDTCRGLILQATCKEAVGEVVNIGSNFEISMADVVNLVKELMNSDIEIVQEKARMRPNKSEVLRLWCDNTKIQKLTGFEPKHSIAEGLQKTIHWFTDKQNLNKYKLDIYNV